MEKYSDSKLKSIDEQEKGRESEGTRESPVVTRGKEKQEQNERV